MTNLKSSCISIPPTFSLREEKHMKMASHQVERLEKAVPSFTMYCGVKMKIATAQQNDSGSGGGGGGSSSSSSSLKFARRAKRSGGDNRQHDD